MEFAQFFAAVAAFAGAVVGAVERKFAVALAAAAIGLLALADAVNKL